tara:strand:- start:617 stop:1183 length:567 start_codon:yes stop_codon:yes gene_type:complete
MEVIAHQAVSGASTSSITFSSIPQTFKHLCMKWSLSGNSTSGVYYKARVQLNDDTSGTNYMFLQQRTNGSSLTTDAFTNDGLIWNGANAAGGGSGTDVWGAGECWFMYYSSTATTNGGHYWGNTQSQGSSGNNDTFLGFSSWLYNSNGAGNSASAGGTPNPEGITKIHIDSAGSTYWTANSYFTLYGV